jgi:uncharacterized membrane protein YgaE (UPF0421/DUF939 family)
MSSLIEEAGLHKLSFKDRITAVRRCTPRHALVAVGALASYWVCNTLWGHPHPYFAPLATVIVLGVSVGTQIRRAAQLVIGIALGLIVADGVIQLVGTGPWQLTVIIFLAMSATVFAGGDPLAVRQAAGAAVLVALVAIPGDPVGVTRFEDGLTGAVIAFLLALFISPIDPIEFATRTSRQIHLRLAGNLRHVADALDSNDSGLADSAIRACLAAEADAEERRQALSTANDAVRFTLVNRGKRGRVAELAKASEHGIRAEQDTVALARAARRPIELGDPIPSTLPDGIRVMADAAEALAESNATQSAQESARESVLEATAVSSASLEETTSLSVSLLVGQMHLVANDLLRGSGLASKESRRMVRKAGD